MSIYLDIKGISIYAMERGGDRYSDPWTISVFKDLVINFFRDLEKGMGF